MALLAFVVFIPAWFESTQNRTEYREVKKEVRTQVKQIRKVSKPAQRTSSAQIADRLFRIGMIRRVIALVLLASILIGGWAATSLSSNLWWFCGSVAGLLFGLLANRRTAVVKRALLHESLSVSRKVKSGPQAVHKYVDELTQAVADLEARAWTPVELPKPMHLLNKVGELEIPTLAQVTPINQVSQSQEQNSETEISVDEILRRRRAI